MFYSLEDAGLLDVSNDAHIFALHYTYLPRIQRQLDIFRESYSQHRIRGQNNRSPYQLWIQGMAHLQTDEDALIGTSFQVGHISINKIHSLQFGLEHLLILVTHGPPWYKAQHVHHNMLALNHDP